MDLLSSRQVDAGGGIVAVPAAELAEAWQRLQPRYPDIFATPAAVPDLWDRVEARACEEAGNWTGAVLHFDRLLASGPDADLFVHRGSAHAELTRWDRAAADYARASQLRSSDRELAAARPALPGGRRLGRLPQGVAELLDARADEGCGGGQLPGLVVRLRPGCGRRPGRPPVRLAEQAARSQADSYAFLNTLGSILYRAGRFEEANRTLHDAVKRQGSGGTGWDCLLMAMTQQRLGHPEEARKWLEKAVTWMEHESAEMSWENRLELQRCGERRSNCLGARRRMSNLHYRCTTAPGRSRRPILPAAGIATFRRWSRSRTSPDNFSPSE